MNEHIGQRIKEYREAKGWTPFNLSLHAQIPEQSIRAWEAGRRTPSSDVIPVIAAALGVTPNDLYGIGAESN